MLADAALVGLDQFFLAFLYIVKEKTGWMAKPRLLPSKRLKTSLDRFIEAESLHPSLHGIHVRRLMLCGFEETPGRRLQRFYHTAAADLETVRKRYLRFDRGTG